MLGLGLLGLGSWVFGVEVSLGGPTGLHTSGLGGLKRFFPRDVQGSQTKSLFNIGA